jgi:hypothetical protein
MSMHIARAALVIGLALSGPAWGGPAGGPDTALLHALAGSTSAYKDYMLNCAGCHRFDGDGVAQNAIPSFRNSIGLFTRLPEGRQYMIRVPGSSQSQLNNAALAEVLNWIVANFSPGQLPEDFRPFTASEVGASRPYRYPDVTKVRHELQDKLSAQGYQPAPYLYGANP